MPASKSHITLKLSFKPILIFLVLIGLVLAGIYLYPQLPLKSLGKNMRSYKNDEYGVSFQYPDYLVLEEETQTEQSKLLIRFTGQECSQIPMEERAHIPYLYFNIQEKDIGPEDMSNPCAQSPNCRASTKIGPFYLENGLKAEIFELFGVSSDGIFLSVKHQGLNYVFSTSEAPVNCGEKYDYIPEIFQMANSLVLK
jgi:hypothetical protein